MKNIKGILAGVLALAALMVSCVAEQDTTPEVDITTVRCTIPRIDVEEDFATGILDTLTATKATFSNGNFLWSAGDKIGIVPNTGAQIYFEVDNGAGTSTASFDGGDWAMKSTGTFYAYYPLYPDIFLSKDHVSVSYTGQTQSGNNNNLHTGDYWTLYTEGTTAIGNALNFSFNHLTSFFKTYVTVPAGTYTKITFSAPTDVFIKDGYFDLSAQTPTIVGTTMTDELSLNLQNVTFADETELTGYLVLAPVDITGVPITVTVYKDGEPAYEYTLTKANPMVAAKTYAFRATALTQLAASATQANALFAAGATSVSITEPLTEDMAIVLPNTSEAVTLILPTTASTSTLTVSYPPAAESYPATLSITGPEGADLDIRTPNSTVTVNGIAYDQVISRTAANTCIIPVGVTVNNLKVVQGGVQVFGTVSQIDLSEQEDDAIINVSGTVTSLLGEDDEEYIPATGVTLNQSSINLNVGATETLIATVAPAGAYPNVIWSSSDETVATVSSTGTVTVVAAGTATITAKTISGGFTATCEIAVSAQAPKYVDLGLSVKWATCNIGALAPEEYGDYFAWGEVESKGDYSWSTYSWCNGSSNTLTKYNIDSNYGYNGFVDGISAPKSEDDVAFVQLGELWRLPTSEEFVELQNNCTWLWTNVNGVNGYKITSKISGYEDKWIFLPAAGCRSGSTLNDEGSTGEYWSSLLWIDNPGYAHYLRFYKSSIYAIPNGTWNYHYRSCGRSIRPVYGEKISVSTIQLNETAKTMVQGSAMSLTATIVPDNATNKIITWESSNTSIATVNNKGLVRAVGLGRATITAHSTDESHQSSGCEITVINQANPNVVDMGLSVKWASFNIGAINPEDYGSYFAWGETASKSIYSWDTYAWSDNGSQYYLTKYQCDLDEDEYGPRYGVVDEKSVLDMDDDAAHAVFGGNWRMPTEAEMRDLLNTDNCDWEWIAMNGVDGYKVTSKIAGYEGNWIFLPAAGTTGWDSSSRYGFYWSSSLDRESPSYAFSISFSDSSKSVNDNARASGLTIRPVLYNPVTSIQLNKTSLRLVPGMREQLTANILPNDATTKTLRWSSSNSNIVSVTYYSDSHNVSLYAYAAGTATITATASDGSGSYATCTVTVLAPTDLSSSGNANCYIVSSAGAFSFPTTKGNSTTSVGSVSTAEVLWESYGTSTTPTVGSIINSVSYSPSSQKIYFVTPSSLSNGNAVIAAKDSGGNILWSWHIWVCSGYNPTSTAQTYYNSAGKMMDRNLGATSATPGSVGALGLQYQWGRKDPFLGGSSISSSNQAASTISWPSAVVSDSSTGTINYAVAHPTTFIKGNDNNCDWYYSSTTSTHTTRWKESKSIYDPCPPGWKVPKGGSAGVWSTASGTSSGNFSRTWNSTNKGMNLNGKFGSASSIWYPASGLMSWGLGYLGFVGSSGQWWSCTINESSSSIICAYTLQISDNGYVYPRSGAAELANGATVRCIKE